MEGGITQWEAEGRPVVPGEPLYEEESLSPNDAHRMIEENRDNPDFLVIDLQKAEDFASAHIIEAVNMPYDQDDFRGRLEALDREGTYLLYHTCACGHTAEKALGVMVQMGFTDVYIMPDGLDSWTALGLPTSE